MSKINVYVTSSNLLTLAAYETSDYYDKETGEVKTKEPTPTKLVGYMEKALVEELPE